MNKKLFVSACEPSANIHLQVLAKKLNTSVRVCGIFEPSVFEGFNDAKPTYTLKDFAVMGFLDVMKKSHFLRKPFTK